MSNLKCFFYPEDCQLLWWDSNGRANMKNEGLVLDN